MIRIEDKDRERLVTSCIAALIFQVVIYLAAGVIDWSSDMPRYETTVLIDLADTTLAQAVVQADTEKNLDTVPMVQAPPAVPEPKEAEKAPEPVPAPVVKSKPEGKSTVVVKPPVAEKKPPVVQPKPAPVRTPVRSAVSSSAPVVSEPRIVPNPADAIPVPVPAVSSPGPKQTTAQPSLPKPEVRIPDWALKSQDAGAAVAGTTGGSSASSAQSANVSQPAREKTGGDGSGIDLSNLDRAIEASSRSQPSAEGEPRNTSASQTAAPPVISTSRTSIDWEDPTEGRTIIDSPPPKMPAWAEREGLRVEVRASIWVSPEGTVSRVEIEKSSGYTEIDSIIKEALRHWRFDPVRSTRTAYGTLPLNIKPNVR